MTLMRRAQHGVTEEIEIVAAKENLPMDVLRRRVASGRVVIPRNVVREIEPCGIGEGLSVKVNVNLGTSKDRVEVEEELEKLNISLKFGADTVMDLSTGGDIDAIRRRILKECPLPVGTVPIYQPPGSRRWWT
jgi:phosphomethylpyrimidine synthase